MKKIITMVLLTLSLSAEVTKGDNAVAFELQTLDATTSYSMDDFKGEVVLVNLWASWCGGCKKEMPEFFTLQQEYKSGFKIVTISIDKSSSSSQEFLESVEKELGYKRPFIALYDPSKSMPKAYGAKGMPSSYLIDKQGVVRDVIVGSLSHDDIAKLKIKIDKLK